MTDRFLVDGSRNQAASPGMEQLHVATYREASDRDSFSTKHAATATKLSKSHQPVSLHHMCIPVIVSIRPGRFHSAASGSDFSSTT